MELLLERLEHTVWGWPLLTLLLGTGIYLMLRLRFYPILALPRAMRLLFRGKQGSGEGVSPFGALCTSLSATIGTGNVIGVATALTLGGPGALLWMELSAVTGLSLKYVEGLLSIRYRERGPDGLWRGGPSVYILRGLGRKGRPLAIAFACFGALAGLCGVGTFVQIGSVSACLSAMLSKLGQSMTVIVLASGRKVPLAAVFVGLAFSVLTGLVIFGGIRRVSRVSTVLVPVMGGLYLLCCLWILCRFSAQIPTALRSVLKGAFHPASAASGLLGTVTAGVSRGVFSHEAGLGTAPIASASAEGVSPEEQGLLSMTAIVFDTFLVCTLTGLVLLVTGTDGGGISAAMQAFAQGLPFSAGVSMSLLVGMLTLFSFTTVIGWSWYGTACLDVLTGGSHFARTCYLIVYTLTVAAAPWCSARGVWSAANLCNACMALPNVSAILLLTPRIGREAARRCSMDAMKKKRKKQAKLHDIFPENVL